MACVCTWKTFMPTSTPASSTEVMISDGVFPFSKTHGQAFSVSSQLFQGFVWQASAASTACAVSRGTLRHAKKV